MKDDKQILEHMTVAGFFNEKYQLQHNYDIKRNFVI